jgi:hypothetical protein
MSVLHVGPARYTGPGAVKFARYGSGEIAMYIVNHEGERECVATVALASSGAEHPGEECVWLKDWSENEGVVDALVKAGIVTLTGKTHATGHVIAKHARLTPAAIAELQRSRGKS